MKTRKEFEIEELKDAIVSKLFFKNCLIYNHITLCNKWEVFYVKGQYFLKYVVSEWGSFNIVAIKMKLKRLS